MQGEANPHLPNRRALTPGASRRQDRAGPCAKGWPTRLGENLDRALAFEQHACMLRSLVGRALRLANREIVPVGSVIPVSRREEAAAELEAVYRHFLFPELPVREGRAKLLARLEGTQIGEALYVLDSLHRSLGVEGDVCEFGVAQGATSALLASEIASTEKRLWLFDSFEGLPRPTAKDVLIDDIFDLGSIDKYQGTMAFGQNSVIGRLRDIQFPPGRVSIVPGFIEKTIKNPGLPEKVCFAYVDFDFYEPIRIALDFLDRVIPPGGHAVVDDYGWFSAGAQEAVDEFVAAHPERWDLALPISPAGKFALLTRRKAN